MSSHLLLEKHVDYLLSLHNEKAKESLIYYMTEHFRISAAYWVLSALYIAGKLQDCEELKNEALEIVDACGNSDGGYGGNSGHDSHMLYTLSAVQVCCLLGAEGRINREAVAKWVAERQKPDGSFEGDRWGEIDTRFSYCALNCLALINKLDYINVEKAVEYVLSCQNWDGGFGVSVGCESHAGQIFCSLGTLAIAGRINEVRKEELSFWLAARQLPSGGLNGRPEKKGDVCYSWWVLSSLAMLQKLHWIDGHALIKYILLCQDLENGGIADKPENCTDAYHTFFGLAGLSLLKYNEGNAKLLLFNPVYALPYEVLTRLEIKNGLEF